MQKQNRKPTATPKPDNPEQYRRFVETARDLGADESPDAMDKAFERVVKPKPAAEKIKPAKSPKDRADSPQ